MFLIAIFFANIAHNSVTVVVSVMAKVLKERSLLKYTRTYALLLFLRGEMGACMMCGKERKIRETTKGHLLGY